MTILVSMKIFATFIVSIIQYIVLKSFNKYYIFNFVVGSYWTDFCVDINQFQMGITQKSMTDLMR